MRRFLGYVFPISPRTVTSESVYALPIFAEWEGSAVLRTPRGRKFLTYIIGGRMIRRIAANPNLVLGLIHADVVDLHNRGEDQFVELNGPEALKCGVSIMLSAKLGNDRPWTFWEFKAIERRCQLLMCIPRRTDSPEVQLSRERQVSDLADCSRIRSKPTIMYIL